MNEGRTILRVSATYHLEVEVGDVVHSGEIIQKVPDTDEFIIAPVSGTVESIHFDSASHEFVVLISSKR
jgi:Na+-translocating ferredoxin:NAD+ oxidoreductase RnfC subunit